MRITVNGIQTEVAGSSVTYEDIASWAGHDPASALSITYRTKSDGTDAKRDGILSRGQSVTIEPGMIFNCYNTSRA